MQQDRRHMQNCIWHLSHWSYTENIRRLVTYRLRTFFLQNPKWPKFCLENTLSISVVWEKYNRQNVNVYGNSCTIVTPSSRKVKRCLCRFNCERNYFISLVFLFYFLGNLSISVPFTDTFLSLPAYHHFSSPWLCIQLATSSKYSWRTLSLPAVIGQRRNGESVLSWWICAQPSYRPIRLGSLRPWFLFSYFIQFFQPSILNFIQFTLFNTETRWMAYKAIRDGVIF